MIEESKTIDLTCTYCAEQFVHVGNVHLAPTEFTNAALNEATERHIATHPENTPTIMLTLDDGTSHYFEPGAA